VHTTLIGKNARGATRIDGRAAWGKRMGKRRAAIVCKGFDHCRRRDWSANHQRVAKRAITTLRCATE